MVSLDKSFASLMRLMPKLSSLSGSLSSCCFVERAPAFHCWIRSVCRHWWYCGSDTKGLVSGWTGAGAAMPRHRGQAQWPVHSWHSWPSTLNERGPVNSCNHVKSRMQMVNARCRQRTTSKPMMKRICINCGSTLCPGEYFFLHKLMHVN